MSCGIMAITLVFGTSNISSILVGTTTQCLQTGVQASLTCADMPKPKL